MSNYERPRRDEMAMVLIEWSIKPNQESADAFMKWWKDEARINDKRFLVGEFLSAPVPQDELPYWADDLGASVPKSDVWKFINVGIWKDKDAFYDEVGQYMTEQRQSFEATRRRRTVLEPQEWRRGNWHLPDGTCD